MHAGLADLDQVHRAAERFNNPIAVIGTVRRADMCHAPLPRFSLARIEGGSVSIETVKKAKHSDAVVLRVFEHANRRAKAVLRFGVPVRSVCRANLMEENIEARLILDEGTLVVSLRPFEIVTLIVEF
ncbi:glycosyl hydrolase-related protein [Devosia sp. CAU 1758]